MISDHDKKVLEDIFGVKTEDPYTIMLEDEWAYGRTNFRPFRMQYLQCNENGNLQHEKCHCCGHELLICKKYGGQCISYKCKEDRTREGGYKQCRLF